MVSIDASFPSDSYMCMFKAYPERVNPLNCITEKHLGVATKYIMYNSLSVDSVAILFILVDHFIYGLHYLNGTFRWTTPSHRLPLLSSVLRPDPYV